MAEFKVVVDQTGVSVSKPPTTSITKETPPNFASFTKDGKISKKGGVWTAKGKVSDYYLNWLEALKNSLNAATYGYYLINDRAYITGGFRNAKRGIQISTPEWYLQGVPEQTRTFGGIPIRIVPGPEDPKEWILKNPLTDLNSAISWPTADKKIKTWMHPDSWLAQFKYTKSGEEYSGDGVNRANIAELADWMIVSDYITHRRAVGRGVKRKAICDLVKTISLNLLKTEEQEERVLLGVDVEE